MLNLENYKEVIRCIKERATSGVYPKICPGMRFGRLMVQESIHDEKGVFRWLCLCDCGRLKALLSGSLNQGTVLSCGCFKTEITRIVRLKHANLGKLKNMKEYRAWRSLRNRCNNKNNDRYAD